MNAIREFWNSETGRIIVSTLLFLVTVIIVFLIYKWVLAKLKQRSQKTKTYVDDFVIDLLRVPVLWLLFWIIFRIFTAYSFISKMSFYGLLSQIGDILLILTVGWILIKIVRVVFYHFENKLNVNIADNINARKDYTKMKIFEGLIVAIITVVTVAICLMTFDKIRAVGISLLTSAGIAGIIAGFAAQKSLGAIFAGIQIAITQPIRLDDQVVVEGETGQIEEINLTYVVVKLWDERRLILPVNYFMETPFQNWTKNDMNILGTVYLYVDYNLPVDILRNKLNELLSNNPKWDKRVANIQVSDSKKDYMELRVLISSKNSSDNWDLRVYLREKLIDFINKEYPDSFVKTRVAGTLTGNTN